MVHCVHLSVVGSNCHRKHAESPSVMNSSLSKSLHAASPDDVSKALAELPPEERQKLQQALHMARPAPRWQIFATIEQERCA